MAVIEINNQKQLDDIKAKPGKKIYYFTAVWCGPCRAIAPVFEKISNEFPDIAFVKIDIDQLSGSSDVAKISSVPTFKFYNGDTLLREFSGASESSIRDTIRALF